MYQKHTDPLTGWLHVWVCMCIWGEACGCVAVFCSLYKIYVLFFVCALFSSCCSFTVGCRRTRVALLSGGIISLWAALETTLTRNIGQLELRYAGVAWRKEMSDITTGSAYAQRRPKVCMKLSHELWRVQRATIKICDFLQRVWELSCENYPTLYIKFGRTPITLFFLKVPHKGLFVLDGSIVTSSKKKGDSSTSRRRPHVLGNKQDLQESSLANHACSGPVRGWERVLIDDSRSQGPRWQRCRKE